MILVSVLLLSAISSFLLVYLTEINWFISLPIFIGFLIVYVFLFIMLCYLIAITVSKKQEILKPKGIFNSMTWYICKFVKQVCLTKVTVSGLEKVKGQKMLVVSNHQSNIDPLLIISVLENMGLTFIMKESILKIPVVGRWLISAGFLSINRENNREGLKTIIRSIKRVENGYPIGVFPEGTRSKGPDMQEFKDGAFKIALRAEAPILVCVIDGTYKTSKNIPFKRTKVNFKVCELIEYERIKDMTTSEVSEMVHEMMEEELVKLRESN